MTKKKPMVRKGHPGRVREIREFRKEAQIWELKKTGGQKWEFLGPRRGKKTAPETTSADLKLKCGEWNGARKSKKVGERGGEMCGGKPWAQKKIPTTQGGPGVEFSETKRVG